MTLSTAESHDRGILISCGSPAATYRLQFNHGFTFQDALALVLASTSWGSVTSTRRPCCGLGRTALTVTTSATRRNSTRPSAATRSFQRWPMRSTNTAWACCSMPCPTTWASMTPAIPGRWMSWKTARAHLSQRSSTSTGIRSRRSCKTESCCPSCEDLYGTVLESGKLEPGL